MPTSAANVDSAILIVLSTRFTQCFEVLDEDSSMVWLCCEEILEHSGYKAGMADKVKAVVGKALRKAFAAQLRWKKYRRQDGSRRNRYSLKRIEPWPPQPPAIMYGLMSEATGTAPRNKSVGRECDHTNNGEYGRYLDQGGRYSQYGEQRPYHQDNFRHIQDTQNRPGRVPSRSMEEFGHNRSRPFAYGRWDNNQNWHPPGAYRGPGTRGLRESDNLQLLNENVHSEIHSSSHLSLQSDRQPVMRSSSAISQSLSQSDAMYSPMYFQHSRQHPQFSHNQSTAMEALKYNSHTSPLYHSTDQNYNGR
eukprot:CFRG8186T1